MSDSGSKLPLPTGIPPGMLDTVLEILHRAPGPIRRRKILQALEERGRTLSLAGLNRLLDYSKRAGLTEESDAGVRVRRAD